MNAILSVALTLFAPGAEAPAPATVRSLAEFGDVATLEGATAALDKGVAEMMAAGGGVLVIPAGAPKRLRVWNRSQTDQRGHTVTIVDSREGFLQLQLPPIGKHQSCVWAGLRMSRLLNLGRDTLEHCGVFSNQSIQNYMVSGSTSYMATLTEPVTKGKDRRLYVDLIRGIWVGQFLNVTSSVMGYKPPYDRIRVKSIGWDPKKRRNYFTADLEHDHAAGVLVYNKNVVNGLSIDGFSNCDNQSMALKVTRRHYAVGDNFVISGMLKYMGDVFCGFGDEGAIVLNAETVGELNGFHSTVEKVDRATNTITYAPGVVMAHTLANSRPLVNMNRKKWLTAGRVWIVPPGKAFRGYSEPGRIGGPGNVFNYQGGVILGSKDCEWTDAIVGRFFAVTDPTEVIAPDDKSTAGGYAKRPKRPVFRWYRVAKHERNDDGTHRIRILRVRWSAVAAGAPKLFVDDNYTWDGHERELAYAIAPGAWVYDVSEGWGDTLATGGWVSEGHARRIRVAPTGDSGTPMDFEPGDPIEQPVGPDPWQPRPLRIRQFDQMPDTMESASIEVQQLGRVQVRYGLNLGGIARRREQLARRKDRKPPYQTAIHVNALADVGLDFHAETLGAAILFSQPNGRAQPIRWRTDKGTTHSLIVSPQTGDFMLSGGNLDLGAKGVQRAAGLSGTDKPAANLRAIDAPVAAGATELRVTFRTPEADARYAVSLTPSWLTALCVPEKTPEGFTVRFAAPAPAKARIDWILVR